jgi:hypothetical protein
VKNKCFSTASLVQIMWDLLVGSIGSNVLMVKIIYTFFSLCEIYFVTSGLFLVIFGQFSRTLKKELRDTKAITNRGKTVLRTENSIILRDTDNVVDVHGDTRDSLSRYRSRGAIDTGPGKESNLPISDKQTHRTTTPSPTSHLHLLSSKYRQ